MPDIRRLLERDRAAWLALRLALWPGDRTNEFEADITLMLADPDTKPAFGAFDGGLLIGFAEAGERAYGNGCDTSPVGWLEGIYIAPEHRRRGVAAALVATVTDWARSCGYAELGSDADIGNHISLASHAFWGFEETGRTVNFRKRLT